VIRALKTPALNAAHREPGAAMRTAVGPGVHRIRTIAPEHEVVLEQAHRERCVAEFIERCDGVPEGGFYAHVTKTVSTSPPGSFLPRPSRRSRSCPSTPGRPLHPSPCVPCRCCRRPVR